MPHGPTPIEPASDAPLENVSADEDRISGAPVEADPRRAATRPKGPQATPPKAVRPAEPIPYATLDQVKAAYETLAPADWVRLKRAASVVHRRSAYQDPDELVIHATGTPFVAAGSRGQQGRAWRTDVPFMAYLIRTIQGLASDSRRSAYSRKRADGDLEDLELPAHESTLELLVAEELATEHDAQLRQLAAALREALEADPWALAVLQGLAEGLRNRAIQERSGMTATQYNSARRAIRRKMEKLRGRGEPREADAS